MADGPRYATIQRPRGDLLAPTRDEHVWIAVAVHRMSPENLRAAKGGDGLNLDRENLATIEVGCLVCEQGYEERLTFRKCPGEPAEKQPRPKQGGHL